MLKLQQKILLFGRLSKTLKKLVAILATLTLAIEACKKACTSSAIENNLLFAFNVFLLKCALCIYYQFYFKNDQAKVQALLAFNGEINTIAPVYAAN